MIESPIALLVALLPLVGGFFVMGMNSDSGSTNVKTVSIWTSCCTLCLALTTSRLHNLVNGGKYAEKINLSEACERWVTVDGFSAVFVPIICIVCLMCMLWIFKEDDVTAKIRRAMIFFFEAFAIAAFYAADAFLLFIFMEAATIPMYVMMSIDKNHTPYAIFKFLIYTISSAFLALVALIMICSEAHTSNIHEIYKAGIKNHIAFWILSIGIAIKMPVWPFYNWLPVAHVKSQTVCSVMLAAISLKFASLLIVRFVEPLFLNELIANTVAISSISIASIICALSQLIFQDDIKRVFAYFSIIHLNMYLMIVLGNLGREYFIFAIAQHSVLTTILFFVTDMVKTSRGTRLISELRSMNTIPTFTKRVAMAAFLLLAAIPSSCNFICEVISVYAAWRVSVVSVVVALASILISSIYAIHIYHVCFSGKVEQESYDKCTNYSVLNAQKFVILSLMAIAVILGIYPNLIFKMF
ncbi:MAG: hypothetical protein LBJ42_01640 [Holosporales bacterium]|jgi:NADH:ubiquinone oxidoreductase subunit 4 (subunit M)|nr:hypothetical protein [Holosporales bacterium]